MNISHGVNANLHSSHHPILVPCPLGVKHVTSAKGNRNAIPSYEIVYSKIAEIFSVGFRQGGKAMNQISPTLSRACQFAAACDRLGSHKAQAVRSQV